MQELPVPISGIPDFCRRWKVRELAFFGSVLRADFRDDSDVDVLVTFAPDAEWSLLDVARMREELKALFGRETDIVEESAVRNPYMRASIRRSKRVLYAA